MKYNDKLVSEYGSFKNVDVVNRPIPAPFKPTPSSTNYSQGFISRTFLVKRNDQLFFQEIEASQIPNVNRSIYDVITVDWKITGNRDKTIVNGIVEDFGVLEYNQIRINELRKKSRVPNLDPLEFWRGY